MSYQTSCDKVGCWKEGLNREWKGGKNWKQWERRGDRFKKRKWGGEKEAL